MLASNQKQKRYKSLRWSLVQAELRVTCDAMLVGDPGTKM